MKATALRYHETGKPEDVLKLEEIDVPAPGRGEVLVKMLAAAINPSDLGMIGGTYGRLRELPAVAGREGCGEVVEAGAGVERLRPGDRVSLPPEAGAWRSHVVADADEVVALPPEIAPAQAALAFVNPPTAWRILEDYVELQPGDWVVQNAANSLVGQSLIQLCAERGVHTLNVVRNPDYEGPLKELGADHVVTEESEYYKKLDDLLGEGVRPSLALNSVGGMSVVGLLRSLGQGGACVTIGGMTGEPIRFPTRQLIFDDISLRGFWLDRWNRESPVADREKMMDEIFARLADGRLRALIHREVPLSQGLEAVRAYASYGKLGKVILMGEG